MNNHGLARSHRSEVMKIETTMKIVDMTRHILASKI